MTYDPSEQDTILRVFGKMLSEVTKDGGRKRAAGTKPPWWRDDAHFPAIFSHLDNYMHGVKSDPDSGAHPLVHLAWRALAIAYQETEGQVDPENIVKLDRLLDFNDHVQMYPERWTGGFSEHISHVSNDPVIRETVMRHFGDGPAHYHDYYGHMKIIVEAA